MASKDEIYAKPRELIIGLTALTVISCIAINREGAPFRPIVTSEPMQDRAIAQRNNPQPISELQAAENDTFYADARFRRSADGSP